MQERPASEAERARAGSIAQPPAAALRALTEEVQTLQQLLNEHADDLDKDAFKVKETVSQTLRSGYESMGRLRRSTVDVQEIVQYLQDQGADLDEASEGLAERLAHSIGEADDAARKLKRASVEARRVIARTRSGSVALSRAPVVIMEEDDEGGDDEVDLLAKASDIVENWVDKEEDDEASGFGRGIDINIGRDLDERKEDVENGGAPPSASHGLRRPSTDSHFSFNESQNRKNGSVGSPQLAARAAPPQDMSVEDYEFPPPGSTRPSVETWEELHERYDTAKQSVAKACRRPKKETDDQRLKLDALKDFIEHGEPPAQRPSPSAHVLKRKEDEEWRKISKKAKENGWSLEDFMYQYIAQAETVTHETSRTPSPRSVADLSPEVDTIEQVGTAFNDLRHSLKEVSTLLTELDERGDGDTHATLVKETMRQSLVTAREATASMGRLRNLSPEDTEDDSQELQEAQLRKNLEEIRGAEQQLRRASTAALLLLRRSSTEDMAEASRQRARDDVAGSIVNHAIEGALGRFIQRGDEGSQALRDENFTVDPYGSQGCVVDDEEGNTFGALDFRKLKTDTTVSRNQLRDFAKSNDFSNDSPRGRAPSMPATSMAHRQSTRSAGLSMSGTQTGQFMTRVKTLEGAAIKQMLSGLAGPASTSPRGSVMVSSMPFEFQDGDRGRPSSISFSDVGQEAHHPKPGALGHRSVPADDAVVLRGRTATEVLDGRRRSAQNDLVLVIPPALVKAGEQRRSAARRTVSFGDDEEPVGPTSTVADARLAAVGHGDGGVCAEDVAKRLMSLSGSKGGEVDSRRLIYQRSRSLTDEEAEVLLDGAEAAGALGAALEDEQPLMMPGDGEAAEEEMVVRVLSSQGRRRGSMESQGSRRGSFESLTGVRRGSQEFLMLRTRSDGEAKVDVDKANEFVAEEAHILVEGRETARVARGELFEESPAKRTSIMSRTYSDEEGRALRDAAQRGEVLLESSDGSPVRLVGPGAFEESEADRARRLMSLKTFGTESDFDDNRRRLMSMASFGAESEAPEDFDDNRPRGSMFSEAGDEARRGSRFSDDRTRLMSLASFGGESEAPTRNDRTRLMSLASFGGDDDDEVGEQRRGSALSVGRRDSGGSVGKRNSSGSNPARRVRVSFDLSGDITSEIMMLAQAQDGAADGQVDGIGRRGSRLSVSEVIEDCSDLHAGTTSWNAEDFRHRGATDEPQSALRRGSAGGGAGSASVPVRGALRKSIARGRSTTFKDDAGENLEEVHEFQTDGRLGARESQPRGRSRGDSMMSTASTEADYEGMLMTASQIIRYLDLDGDGYITVVELRNALSHRNGTRTPIMGADDIFGKLDKDNDGILSKQEIRRVLKKYYGHDTYCEMDPEARSRANSMASTGSGMSPRNSPDSVTDPQQMLGMTATQVIDSLDADGDGRLTKEELRLWLQDMCNGMDQTEDQVFANLDGNNKGYLDKQDIIGALGPMLLPSAPSSPPRSRASTRTSLSRDNDDDGITSGQFVTDNLKHGPADTSDLINGPTGPPLKSMRTFDRLGSLVSLAGDTEEAMARISAEADRRARLMSLASFGGESEIDSVNSHPAGRIQSMKSFGSEREAPDARTRLMSMASFGSESEVGTRKSLLSGRVKSMKSFGAESEAPDTRTRLMSLASFGGDSEAPDRSRSPSPHHSEDEMPRSAAAESAASASTSPAQERSFGLQQPGLAPTDDSRSSRDDNSDDDSPLPLSAIGAKAGAAGRGLHMTSPTKAGAKASSPVPKLALHKAQAPHLSPRGGAVQARTPSPQPQLRGHSPQPPPRGGAGQVHELPPSPRGGPGLHGPAHGPAKAHSPMKAPSPVPAKAHVPLKAGSMAKPGGLAKQMSPPKVGSMMRPH